MIMFVLASRGKKTQLVSVDLPDVKPGHKFNRMPSTEIEEWWVVKVFDRGNQRRLEALQVLLGDDVLRQLFDI